MDSRLDPIFKTQFRHAETLDTRQGIRREEKTGDRGKRDEKSRSDDEPDLWEDSTAVSIKALKAFLEQLVRDSTHTDEGEKINIAPPAPAENENTGPVAQDAARAAGAYERTYRATHEEETAAPTADTIPAIELQPDEIRIIHQLIADLGLLQQRQIEYLTIKKSESFLQSLVDAAAALR